MSKSNNTQTVKTEEKDTQARCWFLTLNNPLKNQAECSNIPEQNKDEIVDVLMSIWTTDPDDLGRGVGCCLEVGDNGTEHAHLALCSASPVRFSTVKKAYPKARIEKGRGSTKAIKNYLEKKDTNEDKKHTQIVEAKYIGLVVNRDTETNSIFEDIDNYLMMGYTPEQLYEMSAKMAHYASAIERKYAAIKSVEIPKKREVKVVYHTGDSGTGKTHSYLELLEEDNDIYFVSGGSYLHPFDNYRYEHILWLDELRSSSLMYNYLLNILDVYPCDLECRYANKKAAWDTVHISTIIPVEDLYFSIKGKDDVSEASKQKNRDSIEQLLRRIDYFEHHFINPFLDGEERYQSFTIPVEAYRDYQQLKIIEHAYIQQAKQKSNGEQQTLDFDFENITRSSFDELEKLFDLPF